MRVWCEPRLWNLFLLAACCLALVGASASTAQQPAAVPAVSLQPYTAPDKSASAGVPAGWTVTKGANGVIQMSGPQGEGVILGGGILVLNGSFKAGQKANGPIAMTMPYQATLAQKYSMWWQQAAAVAGDPSEQVSVVSATPIPLGTVAQCGIFLGKQTNAKGASNFETRFCCLPMDTNGVFKLFWMNAMIPAALAAAERTTAEAVLTSYKPSPAALQLILAPATPPMAKPSQPKAAGGSGMPPAVYGALTADQTSTCMDEAVIRQVPEKLLPPYCR